MPPPHFFTRIKILENRGSSNQDQLACKQFTVRPSWYVIPPPHFQIRSDGPVIRYVTLVGGGGDLRGGLDKTAAI